VAAMFINGSEQMPQAILFSDWSFLLNFPPLKPLGQINRNLVGSIYGKSSIKCGHIVPVSEIIFFYKLTNQKQELPVAAMFVNESGRLEQI
jgi:hypothetical protein